MTTTAPPEKQVPIQPTDRALAWLNGRTFADLKALDVHEPCSTCNGKPGDKTCEECEGTGFATFARKYYPGALRWRGTNGDVLEDKVLFVVPLPNDYIDAREITIGWFARRYKDDTIKTEEAARARAGDMLYAMKEQAALISICARTVEPPHVRAFTPRTMLDLQRFDQHTIFLACEELKLLREMNEIPVASLTDAQFIRWAQEVARVGNASPLLVLDVGLQGLCVSRLAAQFVASLKSNSGSGLPEGSTPET